MSVQITDLYSFDVKNLVFSDAKDEAIPGSEIKNKRIQINYKYPNGEIGPLLISTLEECFSMGIVDNFYMKTQFTGLKCPIFIFQKNGTEERYRKELEWLEKFEAIFTAIKRYVLSKKVELKKFKFEENSFTDFVYRKMDENGNAVAKTHSMSPSVEFKRIKLNKDSKEFTVGEITSLFYDPQGKSLDPTPYRSVKGMSITAVLKIESVLLASKGSINVKLYNCIVHPSNIAAPPVRVMTFKPAQVSVCESNNPMGEDDIPTQPENINDPENTGEKEPAPVEVKAEEKIIRKKVVKKTK